MSIDLKNDEAAVAPEIQAVLDLFERLSDAAKRETMIRLLRRRPTPEERARAIAEADAALHDGGEGLDWGDLTEDDHALLTAQSFAEMEWDEEQARGDRRPSR